MVSFDDKTRYEMPRRSMIDIHLKGRDIRDPRVLDTMAQVPRELFVPEKYAAQAYDDNPLPIGVGQTISQPYIVALMTQCLKLTGIEEVLEIGTGSGYQTAVLAKLSAKVYTIERFNELSEMAQTALDRLQIQNVDFFIGDGSCGWPGEKQFDRIMLTAAVEDIPQPLFEQLKEGGLLVAPLGGPWSQDLVLAEKRGSKLDIQTLCGCRFVKLIGKYGFRE